MSSWQVIAGADCPYRWDTPQHIISDYAEDPETSEIWPGMSHVFAPDEILADFRQLRQGLLQSENSGLPYLEQAGRGHVRQIEDPENALVCASVEKSATCLRIPCRHDVGMQVVGQPARDLCRHFVQRCVNHSKLYIAHSPLRSYVDGIICCALRLSHLHLSCSNFTKHCCRIILELCLSFCPHLSLDQVSWVQWASLVHVRCRYVDLRGLGLWEPQGESNTQSRMPI